MERILIWAVLFFTLGISYAQETGNLVSIRLADGTGTVQVTADALSKAYIDQVTGENAQNKIEVRYENEDGTISILNPRYRYGGRLSYIFFLSAVEDDSESFLRFDGLCKVKGLGKFRSRQVGVTAGGPGQVVLLTTNEAHVDAVYQIFSSQRYRVLSV